MTIKYRTSLYGTPIEKVEIARETAKFIVRLGKRGEEYRDAKESQYTCYFDTYAEAKSYLVQHNQDLVKSAQSVLNAALAGLQQAENLQETT